MYGSDGGHGDVVRTLLEAGASPHQISAQAEYSYQAFLWIEISNPLPLAFYSHPELDTLVDFFTFVS